MTEAERIALIATIPPTVAAIAGMIVSLYNRRKLNKQAEDIQGVKEATNGMKDELVQLTDKESFARGEKSEKDRHDKSYNVAPQPHEGRADSIVASDSEIPRSDK